MADHVMHLAGDPHPLLDDRGARLGFPQRVQLAVAAGKKRVLLPANPEEVTDEQRERDHQEVTRDVAGIRRAGSRDQGGEERGAGRDPDQEAVAARGRVGQPAQREDRPERTERGRISTDDAGHRAANGYDRDGARDQPPGRERQRHPQDQYHR
jgi:hypothetical protein